MKHLWRALQGLIPDEKVQEVKDALRKDLQDAKVLGEELLRKTGIVKEVVGLQFEHSWSVETFDGERVLANRIAQIIGYQNDCPPFKKESGTWVLNGTNDWFLDISKGTANLSYRYIKQKEDWMALKLVIEMAVK